MRGGCAAGVAATTSRAALGPRARRRLAVAAALLCALLLASDAAARTVGASDSGSGPRAVRAQGGEVGREGVDRLLVVSLPHVTWERLEDADTPNLDALVEDSTVGNLAVRVVRRKTSPETGYTTIGAGTRAEASGSDDLVLAPSERFERGTGLEAYRRRMGHSSDATVLALSVPEIESQNDDLLFDAVIGELGGSLAAAGIHRAVIGNADTTVEGRAPSDFDRPVALMLMDGEGRVPGGRVDRGLLARDPEAPYGLRLDGDAVLEAFEAEWRDRAVVAVEMSDLVRAEEYRGAVRERLRDGMFAGALEDADRLVGRLLEHVDPARDGVLVVGPASPQGEPRLTVAAVRAPAFAPSLLVTSTTRRDGFLTIYDVGAGIAGLVGVEHPDSMEGRAFEVGSTGGGAASRRDFLVTSGREAAFRDRIVGTVTALFVALQIALAFLAFVVLRWGARWARALVAWAALVVLGVLPMQYLAGALDFADPGLAAYLPFVFGGAGVVALLAWLVGRRDPVRAAAAVLGLLLAVVVGNVVLADSVLQFNTVFGDSPIVAGRFTGINNLTFAQLAAAGIIGAVLLAHRFPGRRGALGAVALLGFLLVVDGHPRWGADVGGVLSAVPAFGYVGYRLWGTPLRIRTVALIGLATLAVIAAFAAYDLSQSAEDRSHLARLLEQVDAQGFGALVTVVLRKAAANLRVITSSVWLLMVPGALAFAAYLYWRRSVVVEVIERRMPRVRIALGGLLVLGVLGFALNDSGIAVPGMVLGVLNPVVVHLSVRMAGRQPAAATAGGSSAPRAETGAVARVATRSRERA